MTAIFDIKTAPLDRITLVEASAGTGKTYSIKHLVLRLIVERDIALDKILVMTFTKAATAELARRIEEHLRAVLEVLDELQRGRSPSGDALLVDQLALWRTEGLTDEVIAARLNGALAVLDRTSILTIHSFCQKIFENRAFSAGAMVTGELSTDEKALLAQVVDDFLMKEITLEVQQGGDGSRFFIDEKPLDREEFAKLLQSLVENPAPIAARYLCADTSSAMRAALERFIEEAPKALERLKAEQGVYTYADMIAKTWRALRDTTPLADGVSLAERFARAVREDYRAALIDEFQDTDGVQLDIVERLFFKALPEAREAVTPCDLGAAREGEPAKRLAIESLFFVGDPKQAIYSFRGADLLVYLALRARLHPDSIASLSSNFRSTPALVEALNALFSASATGATPDPFLNPALGYSPVAAKSSAPPLLTLKEGVWCPAPVLVFYTNWGKYLINAEPGREALVNLVVSMINEGQAGRLWIACEEHDAEAPPTPVPESLCTKPLRRVRAGDFAILSRSNSSLEAFAKAFSKAGVRTQVSSDRDVCGTSEAHEIRAVLWAVNNPGDEAALKRALLTRVLGFDMARINALTEKAKSDIRATLIEARRLWQHSGIAVAFEKLFSTFNTEARLLSEINGAEALTNYAHLVEILHETGRRWRNPAGLIERFEAMMQKKDEARTVRMSANEGLLQLITAHKAKGLEYPIVLVDDAGSWVGEQKRGQRKHYLAVRSTTPGTNERCLEVTYPSKTLSEFGPEVLLEANQEVARLLYVAFTRAKCQLVIPWRFGTVKSGKNWSATAFNVFSQMLVGHGVTASSSTVLDALSAFRGRVPREAILDLDPDTVPTGLVVQPDVVAATPLGLAPSRGAPIKAAWRTQSFTGLSRETLEPGSFPRYTLSETSERGERCGAEPQDEIRAFPRGAAPGECLHSMFEVADFTQLGAQTPEALAARRALATEAIDAALMLSAEDRARAIDAAASILGNVLLAELLPGFRLRDLAPEQKHAELYFLMKTAQGVNAEGLRAVLAAMGDRYAVPSLADGELAGYLQGFIDLAFFSNGRYWILDWKSNVCGAEKRSDFTAQAIDAEMAKHHYRLQYLIYAVALRRHLKARLGARFHDGLIGGSLYVFLRGVSEENRTPEGLAAGIDRDLDFPPMLGILDDYLAGTRSLHDALTALEKRSTL